MIEIKVFKEMCWYPQHKDNIDSYIDFGFAVSNNGGEILIL